MREKKVNKNIDKDRIEKFIFSAAILFLLRALKRVDFPTFGSPTNPQFKFIVRI